MKNSNFILAAAIVILIVSGCRGGKTETDSHKSGRLEFVEHLRFGPAGTHGSDGWYVEDREFKVNGHSWQPENIDLTNISCEAAPGAQVEALKCLYYADMKTNTYILRMNADQPEFVKIRELEFNEGDDSGIWVGDGGWLLFKDFYDNVETSERREIKGLPDYPEKYFIKASPDLETIIYEENCSMGFHNRQTGEKIPNKLLDERCQKYYKGGIYEGVAAYWLIDAKTGGVKILELKEQKYPSLKRGIDIPGETRTNEIRKMLVWEKDKNGKDQLVAPN